MPAIPCLLLWLPGVVSLPFLPHPPFLPFATDTRFPLFFPSPIIKCRRLKEKCIKDADQHYKLFFFFFLSFGRPANIVYCLDEAPFSQDLFFRSSFGSLAYPDVLLLSWKSPMQEAISMAGRSSVRACETVCLGERPGTCRFLTACKYFFH